MGTVVRYIDHIDLVFSGCIHIGCIKAHRGCAVSSQVHGGVGLLVHFLIPADQNICVFSNFDELL